MLTGKAALGFGTEAWSRVGSTGLLRAGVWGSHTETCPPGSRVGLVLRKESLLPWWGHPAVGPRGVQAFPVFPERLTLSLVTFAAGAQWVMPTADEDDV